jgi:hypothetical protein
MEPPVSVAVAARQRCAATAADEPPEDPPGTIFASGSPWRRHGEMTGPKALVSFDEPIANSSRFNLPREIAPSRIKFDETVDSYVGVK